MPFLQPYITPVAALGAITPRTIMGANLVGWWNADDTSRITIATGISNWTDSIGSYALAQATGSVQPSLVSWAGAVQGSGAQFDGVDDFLRLTSTPGAFPISTNTSEIWVLASQDIAAGTATTVNAFNYGATGTGVRAVRRTVSTSTNRASITAGGVVITNASTNWSGRHYVRASFVNGAGDVALDGTAGPGGSLTLATTAANTTMGGSNASTPASFFGGIIAQVLVLDTTPSAGQITALNAYFAARL